MLRGAVALAAFVPCFTVSFGAQAARTPFAGLEGGETMPQGDLEVQLELDGRLVSRPPSRDDARLRVGPRIGVHDWVELAVPAEVVANERGLALARVSLGARVQLLDPWTRHLVRPLLRFAFLQNFTHPDEPIALVPWWQVAVDATAGDPEGVFVSASAGAYGDFRVGDEPVLGHTLEAGVTYPWLPDLQAGLEYAHDLGLGARNRERYRVELGPSVAWRGVGVWASLGVMLGLLEGGPLLTARLRLGLGV